MSASLFQLDLREPFAKIGEEPQRVVLILETHGGCGFVPAVHADSATSPPTPKHQD
jgi:hypothetical protein